MLHTHNIASYTMKLHLNTDIFKIYSSKVQCFTVSSKPPSLESVAKSAYPVFVVMVKPGSLRECSCVPKDLVFKKERPVLFRPFRILSTLYPNAQYKINKL